MEPSELKSDAKGPDQVCIWWVGSENISLKTGGARFKSQ